MLGNCRVTTQLVASRVALSSVEIASCGESRGCFDARLPSNSPRPAQSVTPRDTVVTVMTFKYLCAQLSY
jgi:hypothetical protein